MWVTTSTACVCASSETYHTAVERKCFIDNLLVRIHYIIVMIKWTGLAP